MGDKRWADVSAEAQTHVIQRLRTEIADLRGDRARAVEAIKWPEAVQAADEKIEAVQLAIEELYLARVAVEESGPETTSHLPLTETMPSVTDYPVPALPPGLVLVPVSEGQGATPARVLSSRPVGPDGSRPFQNGDVVRHKPTCQQGIVTSITGGFAYLRGKGPFRLTDLEHVV